MFTFWYKVNELITALEFSLVQVRPGAFLMNTFLALEISMAVANLFFLIENMMGYDSIFP